MFMALFFMNMCFSQYNKSLQAIERDLKAGKRDKALTRLTLFDTVNIPDADKAYYLLLNAKIHEELNIDDVAYKSYLQAKQYFITADSLDKAMDINIYIAYLAESRNSPKKINSQKYLDEYLRYANKENDTARIIKGYIELASLKISPEGATESKNYFREAERLNKNYKNEEYNSLINANLAALYNDYLNKPDSALFHLTKDLVYLKNKNDIYSICMNYCNQAVSHYLLSNYKQALLLLDEADKLPLNKYYKSLKSSINQVRALIYEAMGDYKNAYKSLLLHKTFLDSLNNEQQIIAVNDIETQYHTKEKELENLQLANKVTRNKILSYALGALLLLLLIISFLTIKSIRRKQKILKQEKLIEEQKLEKALKDHELTSIDLMLEGQEKERQRIANDLHDNLGSMLATLKINFEHLKLRKNELRNEETKLYERTDELIEEAYQKVRRLAHAKHAGVLANEGLIPALRKLADKISIPGKLQVQVITFGFDERIENTLEITVFRMIQELATNIIKHAEATEAVIHLTHHENTINIIIEDNGKGFDNAAMASDGMGIMSIQKKAEQLGGLMTIDSIPGRGTTIIIDIPV